MGDHVVGEITCDGKVTKPVRKTDLSPREEMAELQKEIKRLEEHRQSDIRVARTEGWTELLREDNPTAVALAAAKKRYHELDFVFNDHKAPPQVISTLADLNRLQEKHYATQQAATGSR